MPILKEINEDASKLTLIDTYPFPSFRPGTEKALNEIENAFSEGKRFVLVDASTGSGKSAFSISVARKHNSVVLTPTKILQEQYATTQEFSQEFTVKGKSNYRCGLPGLGSLGVNESICVSDTIAHESRNLLPAWISLPEGKARAAGALKKKCAGAGICPYYTKIYNIGKVPGAILNYDLFFRIKQYPGQKYGTDVGDTLVLDEAHQLIDKVREIFGFKFSQVAAKKLLGDDSGKRKRIPHNKITREETALEWLARVLEIVKSRMMLEKDSKKASRYDMFLKKAQYIFDQDLEDKSKFFIDDKGEGFEVKPLDLRFLKGKIFFPFKRIVLLSATFPTNFKEIFGITDDESQVVRVPSSFSPNRRPILFAKDLPRLNRNTVFERGMPSIDLLDQILATHKNHKGIIHTANYKFLDQLQNIYRGEKRFIWVNRGEDKNRMLEMHVKAEDPTVLVSPSMMEGLDLKDDLARFGVILKVPFPMLDEYTKKMMDLFKSWYENLTATNISQAYGRNVRSAEDWANFYILDGAFNNCVSRSRDCYSSYFLEALKMGNLTGLTKWLKNKENGYDEKTK